MAFLDSELLGVSVSAREDIEEVSQEGNGEKLLRRV